MKKAKQKREKTETKTEWKQKMKNIKTKYKTEMKLRKTKQSEKKETGGKEINRRPNYRKWNKYYGAP